MSITLDDSQFITNLHQRMIANRQAGRPDDEGITAEELGRMIKVIKGNRMLAGQKAATPRKSKSTGPVAPMSDEDLNNLFS